MISAALAMDKQKTKYVWGGGRTQKDIANGVFDCSSFVHYAFDQAGIDLGPLSGTNTRTLREKGTAVKGGLKNAKPGDLIFFDTNRKDGHVGIYLGDGKFIGAQTKNGVEIVDINNSSYWTKAFKGNIRRIDGASAVTGGKSRSVQSNTGIGSLSAQYESRGGVGTISSGKGDVGGKSYGTYQLTTASGNAQKFANSYGGSLKGKKVGTKAFDQAWQAEARKNPQKFQQAQHNYVIKTHYTPGVSKIKSSTGVDANKRSSAVQNVVWSVSVQHGSGGAGNLFKNAGITNKMTDEQIIRAVYKERMKVDKYFSKSSAQVKASVKKRFQQELQDALNMLRGSNRGR